MADKITEKTAEIEPFMTACREAAVIGGDQLMDWRGRFSIKSKAPSDLVTEADLAAQQAIRDHVIGAFPDHDFLGEESPDSGNEAVAAANYQWIVDPLDGTTNYVYGFPYFCVSVALVLDGEALAGTVYNPVTKECFTASRGGGAFLNNHPISVSDTATISESLLAASFPNEVDRSSIEVTRFLDVLDACRSVRRLGAAALNLSNVAAGRLDGYWASTVKAWDVAAGILLVEEAGGVVSDMDGSPFRLSDHPSFVVASTKELHDEIRPLLK